jgi:hypothetical protein
MRAAASDYQEERCFRQGSDGHYPLSRSAEKKNAAALAHLAPPTFAAAFELYKPAESPSTTTQVYWKSSRSPFGSGILALGSKHHTFAISLS